MAESKIRNDSELQRAIQEIEQKISIQESAMSAEFEQVKENLQPKNLVKNTFSQVSQMPEIRRTLIHTLIGFGLAYMYKKSDELFNKRSMDQLIQNLVGYAIEKVEEKDHDGYVAKAIGLLRKVVPEDSPYHPFLHKK